MVHPLYSPHILSIVAQAHLAKLALNKAVQALQALCLAYSAVNSFPHLAPLALLVHLRVSGTKTAGTAAGIAVGTGVGGTGAVPAFGMGTKPIAFKAQTVHACTTCPVLATPDNFALPWQPKVEQAGLA